MELVEVKAKLFDLIGRRSFLKNALEVIERATGSDCVAYHNFDDKGNAIGISTSQSMLECTEGESVSGASTSHLPEQADEMLSGLSEFESYQASFENREYFKSTVDSFNELRIAAFFPSNMRTD